MWAERSELRDGLFIDAAFPSPRLIIFGAIDFAAQLCTLARTSGWRPYVVDPRSRFAAPERFPDAEAVIAGWPAEAFAQLGGIDEVGAEDLAQGARLPGASSPEAHSRGGGAA